jgi:hypothetical protein
MQHAEDLRERQHEPGWRPYGSQLVFSHGFLGEFAEEGKGVGFVVGGLFRAVGCLKYR